MEPADNTKISPSHVSVMDTPDLKVESKESKNKSLSSPPLLSPSPSPSQPLANDVLKDEEVEKDGEESNNEETSSLDSIKDNTAVMSVKQETKHTQESMNELSDKSIINTTNEVTERKVKEENIPSKAAAKAAATATQSVLFHDSSVSETLHSSMPSVVSHLKIQQEQQEKNNVQSASYQKEQYRLYEDSSSSSYHHNSHHDYPSDYYNNNRDRHNNNRDHHHHESITNKGTYKHYYSTNPTQEYHNYDRNYVDPSTTAPTPPPLPSVSGQGVHSKNASSVFRRYSSNNKNDIIENTSSDNKDKASNVKQRNDGNNQYLTSDANMLLSLKTPPASFDERDNSNNNSKKVQQEQEQRAPNSVKTRSPKEPPQIQNVSCITPSSTFVPKLTPTGTSSSSIINNNVSIEMAPSFPLFNQSFDSISDHNNSNTQVVSLPTVGTAPSFSITDINGSFGQSFGEDTEFVEESINGVVISSNEDHHPSSPVVDTTSTEITKIITTPHNSHHHPTLSSGQHDNYGNYNNDISPTSHHNNINNKPNSSNSNVMLLGASPTDSYGYPSNTLETNNNNNESHQHNSSTSRSSSSNNNRPHEYHPTHSNQYDDSYNNNNNDSNYYDSSYNNNNNKSPSYHHPSSSRSISSRSRHRDDEDHHQSNSGYHNNKSYSSSQQHRPTSSSYHRNQQQHPHSPPSVRNSSRNRNRNTNYQSNNNNNNNNNNESPHHSMPKSKHHYEMNGNNDDPFFYETLRKFHKAFAQCTFILPGLKFTIMQYQQQVLQSTSSNSRMTAATNLITSTTTPERSSSSNSSNDSNLNEYQPIQINDDKTKNELLPYAQQQPAPQQLHGSELTEEDVTVTTRRITSAICAFGGTKLSSRQKMLMVSSFSSSYHNHDMTDRSRYNNTSSSIFRRAATTTTSSGTSVNNNEDVNKLHYENYLSKRFYESDNHLSWENEENPPVGEGGSSMINNNSGNRRGATPSSSSAYHVPSSSSSSPGRSKSSLGGHMNDIYSKENNDLGNFGTASHIDIPTSVSPTLDNRNSPTLAPPSIKSELSSSITNINTNESNNSDINNDINPQQPKMKYRCKLCGQPKQNHSCPYNVSLQRSIGAMVYPAINSFIADEPGLLAPPLSEMNNFVTTAGLDSENNEILSPGMNVSPDRENLTSGVDSGIHPVNITPANTFRHSDGGNNGANNPNKNTLLSPGSSITFSPHGTPYRKTEHRHITPTSAIRRNNNNAITTRTRTTIGNNNNNLRRLNTDKYILSARRRMTLPSTKKRKQRSNFYRDEYEEEEDMMMTQQDPAESLFIEEIMEIRTEQFRVVTPQPPRQQDVPTNENINDAYSYPSLPLPYSQRKRLSDSLFSLSKEIPQLTDECAVVLREARERDMWDQAVAELMTQVIVIVHCHSDDDRRLVGLRHYLLALGIAC